MKASDRIVQRHPLGWGMTKWGPLPGTRDMWILWGGPGDGLELYVRTEENPAGASQRIRHPTASGTYGSLAEAEKAVNAFVRIGLEV
jgi:hypothetical protein